MAQTGTGKRERKKESKKERKKIVKLLEPVTNVPTSSSLFSILN
jgi:hypothetical protein